VKFALLSDILKPNDLFSSVTGKPGRIGFISLDVEAFTRQVGAKPHRRVTY
jgi:hypothetical protein